MKAVLYLILLFPACVFAQTGNLPTIKDPKGADRIETKTRRFPAAFRLDTLKAYFVAEANDSLAVHRVDIDANAGAINALEGQNDGVVTSGLVTGSTAKTLSLTRTAPLSVLEVDFTDLVNDADSDAGNEIQTFGNRSGTQYTLSDGGTIDVADDDNDSTNELDSKWTESGGHIYRNSRVSIGTSSTASTEALYIEGAGVSVAGRTRFAVKNTSAEGAANFSITNNAGQSLLVQVSGEDYTQFSDAIGILTTNNGLDMVVAAGGGSPNAGTGDIQFRLGGYRVTPQFTMRVETATGDNRKAFLGVNKASPTHEIDVAGTVNATDFIGDGSALTDVNAELLDGQNGSFYEKLTQLEVDAFADNSGYLKSEVDGSITNEIQTFDVSALIGTDLNLSLSGDDEDTKEIDLSSLQDGTGTDDQTLSISGRNLTIEDGNTIPLPADANTQLTQLEVDAFADNSGYLKSEVDGSITNEIQTFDVSALIGTDLNLSLSGDDEDTKEIDLSSLQDGNGVEDGGTVSIPAGTQIQGYTWPNSAPFDNRTFYGDFVNGSYRNDRYTKGAYGLGYEREVRFDASGNLVGVPHISISDASFSAGYLKGDRLFFDTPTSDWDLVFDVSKPTISSGAGKDYQVFQNARPSENGSAQITDTDGTTVWENGISFHYAKESNTSVGTFPSGSYVNALFPAIPVKPNVRYEFELIVYYTTGSSSDGNIKMEVAAGTLSGAGLTGEEGTVTTIASGTPLILEASTGERRKKFTGYFTVSNTTAITINARGVSGSATINKGSSLIIRKI